jgi:hypothetical protein
MYIIILSIVSFSCSDEKEIDYAIVEKLGECEKIKDVLLKIKDSLNLPYKTSLYQNDTNLIFSSNFLNFENKILLNNPLLKSDLSKISTIWKENLNFKDGYIVFEKDNTIELNVKFYNGGITDSSYNHSIVYDPNNVYVQNGRKCSDLYLVKILKGYWKYVICRTAFN